MIKKRYIKRAYMIEAFCDRCGAPLRSTGRAYLTNPMKYPYVCSNANECGCFDEIIFYENDKPGTICYEFYEDDFPRIEEDPGPFVYNQISEWRY